MGVGARGGLDDFRAEIRGWLEANCPPEMRGPMREEDQCYGGRNARFKNDAQRLWLERMAARGWTAPGWPKDYGGGGLNAAQAAILADEMARIDARRPLTSLGVWMLGPALLKFGTDEQKRRHLPPIVRGEIWWCQGYSEPGAGSDLASLQTRARLEGDEFVVTGQKIWTSYGHRGDWIFCLVRTDPAKPRHDGISFLLIDLRSRGISASSLRLISGIDHFSQVFFDEVRVPKENLVGTLNRGWDVAKYLLLFERQMIGNLQIEEQRLGEFALHNLGPEGLRAEPVLRAQIIALDMEVAAFEAVVERYRDEAEAGAPPGAKSSLLKYFATELNLKRHELMMSILGTAGLDRDAALAADVSTEWLNWITHRIGGGSSEIQLNVVAKRVLELPGT